MKTIALGLALGLAVAMAQAATPTADDARIMATQGAAVIKTKGREELAKRIHAHDPQFVQDALALTMRDLYTGVVIAHPVAPSRAGTDDAGTDPVRRHLPRQVIELAQRSGEGSLEHAYVVRVGDVVLEAGLVQK